jgi:hypothetical protein
VPTSVLLAVLAAAGLLALAPALTRRYDATERVAAERATSTARVLSRRRRRRTVPGPRPINPPSFFRRPVWSPSSSAPTFLRSSPVRSASTSARRAAARRPVRRRPVPTALHRRRRVLVSLALLNLVELAGVLLVGPGFWIGFAVTFTALLADLVYLRHRAVVTARRRRAGQRRLAWIATEQAAVRREHDRRAAQREAAIRRLTAERDLARREAARLARDYVERYTPRSAPGP